MKPENIFLGRPVRSLQTMLRVIGESQNQALTVVPDGIYGNQTRNAVTAFQRQSGLPATGVADQTTWEAVVRAYEPALIYVSEAQPVEVILNPNEVLRAGSTHPHMYMVQSILVVLSQAYGSIPAPSVSGVLDIPTAESLSAFQQLNQLPVTGELDKVTWKSLALQYPAAINLLTSADQPPSRA